MHRHFCLKRQEWKSVKTLLYLCIVERKETLFFREKRKIAPDSRTLKKTFVYLQKEKKNSIYVQQKLQ